MIVGTRNGLLIFESTLLIRSTNKNTETAPNSSDVHMSVRYKLSVLPDESVVDLVEAGDSNRVLVCCQAGSYVILSRSGTNVMQEIWRFRGFSQPPKCLIETGDPNKIIVVEKEGLSMIDQKRKSIMRCKRSDLSHLLAGMVGLQSCALVG